MKYSEFKTEVEKLDWCVTGNKYEVHVLNHGGGKLMVIDKTDTHMLDPNHISYVTLTHEDKSVLLDLSVKLAKTPLAEREEEKRYYLRNVSPLLRGSGRGYLAKNKDTLEYYALSLKCSEEFYQTIFTESEIAQIDTTGFVKVEVTEC